MPYACGKQYALNGSIFQKSDGTEAMAKMTWFKDRMCACKDSACMQQVSDEMTKWGQDQARSDREPPKMSEADMKAFTAIGEQMGTCMQKVMGATP